MAYGLAYGSMQSRLSAVTSLLGIRQTMTKTGPILHEPPALVDQVAALIGRFDLAFRLMGQRLLDGFTAVIGGG